jgi:hypothetical protein
VYHGRNPKNKFGLLVNMLNIWSLTPKTKACCRVPVEEANIWGIFEHFWPIVWPQDTNKIIYYYCFYFLKVKDFLCNIVEAKKLESSFECFIFFFILSNISIWVLALVCIGFFHRCVNMA